MSPEEIDTKVKEIDFYRNVGFYLASDHIRDTLTKQGVIVENLKNGTSRWRYK